MIAPDVDRSARLRWLHIVAMVVPMRIRVCLFAPIVACLSVAVGVRAEPPDQREVVESASSTPLCRAEVNLSLEAQVTYDYDYASWSSGSQLEEMFGPPQAVLTIERRKQRCVRHYYTPVPGAHKGPPISLGPIMIAYSQYDTVLGKVYYGAVPGSRKPGSGTDTDANDRPRKGKWVEKFQDVKVGMHRSEVDRVLGVPQAYDCFHGYPYAPGPAITHWEMFYGPVPDPEDWDPVALGPVSVVYNLSLASFPVYHHRGPGKAVQSWPARDESEEVLPLTEGWADRYRCVKVGMKRAEVETFLGPPVNPVGAAVERRVPCTVHYGSPQRRGWWDSNLCFGKIDVSFSSDGVVVGKRYNFASTGYESRLEPEARRGLEPAGSLVPMMAKPP